MKTLLLATVSAIVLSSGAHADDRADFQAPLLRAGPPQGDRNSRYFHPIERVLAPFIQQDFRYPRPQAYADGLDILDGAGAPVPVDPVTLVEATPLGVNSVPVGMVSERGYDAKGDARHDRHYGRRSADHGRQAW